MNNNRVWIELEQPWGSEGVGIDHELGRQRAKLADNMLRKLISGFPATVPLCFWLEDEQAYCFTIDEAGGFMQASDGGHWYDLSELGK